MILPAVEKRRIMNMVLRYLKPNTKWMKTMILGRPFVVEAKEWEQWASDYEPHTTDFILKNVRRGDVVLDIGAHVGYYTLLFARLVGEMGTVYAFEPNPDVMKVLKYNVKINGFQNVVFIQKAASNKSEKSILFVPEVTDAASLRPMTGVRKVHEVESVRIDDLDIKIVNFIKMDVEGAELDALRGMEDMLSWNFSAKLVIEFCPENLGQGAAGAMMALLDNYDVVGMDRNIVCTRRK